MEQHDHRLIAAATVSMAGLVIHNLAEFPASILVMPDTLGPVVATVLLVAAAMRRPGRPIWIVIAGWALLHVTGAVLTVLPLPFLPFEPEQSLAHFGAHVVYVLAQVPLLLLATRRGRNPRVGA